MAVLHSSSTHSSQLPWSGIQSTQHAAHALHVESSVQMFASAHSVSTHSSHVAWSVIQSTQHASHGAVQVESPEHVTAPAEDVVGALLYVGAGAFVG